MNQLVDFLSNNWKWLSALLVGLIELVFIIFKKPYKVYGYYLDFVNWVNEAEKEFGDGHGEDKLEYVYQKYIRKYSDTNYTFARTTVKNAVEKILETPQKKGVK